VVGTRFRVARSAERITVEVDHGIVDVHFRGQIISVGAGRHWSWEAPVPPSSVAAGPGAPAADDPEPEIDPVDAPAAPPRHQKKRTPRPVVKPAPMGSAAVDPASDAAHAAAIDRERVEYERLAALEPRQPETALRGYIALAQGTSRWA